MLLLKEWVEFASLLKSTQFVLYRHGKNTAVFFTADLTCNYSMDGFKVVKLEDICHFVDIVITCTGKLSSFTRHTVTKLQEESILSQGSIWTS